MEPTPPPGTPGAPDEQPKWRDDFPIDRPEDEYVARREFTRFMVLVSGAFAVGQLWIALQNLIRRSRGLPPRQRIARLSDVPVGGTLLFDYPTPHDPCLLVRTSETEFMAYSSQCTHLMCPVIPRPDEGTLHCPCHSGWFDLSSGRPLAGPPRRPLPRVLLEIRGDEIHATGIEMAAR